MKDMQEKEKDRQIDPSGVPTSGEEATLPPLPRFAVTLIESENGDFNMMDGYLNGTATSQVSYMRMASLLAAAQAMVQAHLSAEETMRTMMGAAMQQRKSSGLVDVDGNRLTQ